MPKIFISYRREDSQYQADRLHGALARRMPRRDIFIDVDNIPVGVDFAKHLDNQVAQCDVLLAVIGPGWLGAGKAQSGERRLDDPKDFVRIEIASALRRGIQVAPVLLDGTPLPTADQLPDELKPLVLRNAIEVRRATFDADAKRMIRGLKLIEETRRDADGKARPGSGKGMLIASVLLVLALGGAGAWVWMADPFHLVGRSEATARLVSVAVNAGQLELAEKTEAAQQRAIQYFESALAEDDSSLEANLGLGQAKLWLAENAGGERKDNYTAAQASLTIALKRADELKRTEDWQTANSEMSRVLTGLSKLTDAETSAKLRSEAIERHETSVSANPSNPNLRLTLAQAYEETGRLDEAEKALEAAITLYPIGSADAADALMRLARVKSRQRDPDPSELADLYARARAVLEKPIVPNMEIGRIYYAQDKILEAEPFFRDVIRLTGGDDGPAPPDTSKYKAEAYYYASQIDFYKASQKAGASLASSIANAEMAVRIGGAISPYVEQACLTRIVNGGAKIQDAEHAIWCNASDNPQQLLLRGMFYLRAAQFSNAESSRASRNSANFAFEQGVKELERLEFGDQSLSRRDLPGAPPAPGLKQLLLFGSAVAQSCSGMSVSVDLPQQAMDQAQRYFEFYRVFSCTH